MWLCSRGARGKGSDSTHAACNYVPETHTVHVPGNHRRQYHPHFVDGDIKDSKRLNVLPKFIQLVRGRRKTGTRSPKLTSRAFSTAPLVLKVRVPLVHWWQKKYRGDREREQKASVSGQKETGRHSFWAFKRSIIFTTKGSKGLFLHWWFRALQVVGQQAGNTHVLC